MQITVFRQYHLHLMLMIIFACLLTSCSNNGAHFASEQDKTEISIMVPLHFTNLPSDEVMNLFEQYTNTELDISWIPDGIYSDKLNTALMTNSFKKVMFVKYTDYMLVKNSIRAGAFWEIGPYLEQFPNLKQLNPVILQQSAVDGKIYGLFSERQSSRQGIIIRKDWLDKLELAPPTNLEELYDVLYQFTYNDPDGNGIDDTIGLTDRNDLIYGAFKTLSSYFGTPNNWELKDGKIIPEFESEGYRLTMDYMRKIYSNGLMNEEFPVTSKDKQRELLIRGKAGVYIGAMTDVQRLYEEAKHFNESVEFTVVNRIEGPTGFHIWSIPNFNGVYLFSKKAIPTEEELLKILAFFDRTLDADVANLMRYGILDKHYYVEDGKVVLPEELTEIRMQEIDALYSLMIASYSNENIMEIKIQHPLWSYAEELIKDNEQFIVSDPTVGLESLTFDERGSELYNLIADATYNYILGSITLEQFNQEVLTWRANGGNQIIKEFQESYNQKTKSNNEGA